MSCGEAHVVALCASGEVVTWGCGIHGEAAVDAVMVYSVTPQLVPMLGVLHEKETVWAVHAGGHRSVVVTSQNRLLSWGEGDHQRPEVLVSTLDASDVVTDLAVERERLFVVDTAEPPALLASARNSLPSSYSVSKPSMESGDPAKQHVLGKTRSLSLEW